MKAAMCGLYSLTRRNSMNLPRALLWKPGLVASSAIGVLMLSFLPVHAQDTSSQPITFPKVSKQDGLSLGNGVSLAKVFPAYSSPFKQVTSARQHNLNPTASIQIKAVSSSKAMDSEF